WSDRPTAKVRIPNLIPQDLPIFVHDWKDVLNNYDQVMAVFEEDLKANSFDPEAARRRLAFISFSINPEGRVVFASQLRDRQDGLIDNMLLNFPGDQTRQAVNKFLQINKPSMPQLLTYYKTLLPVYIDDFISVAQILVTVKNDPNASKYSKMLIRSVGALGRAMFYCAPEDFDPNQRENINVKTLIVDFIASRGFRGQVEYIDGMETISVHPLFSGILENLIGNAFKHGQQNHERGFNPVVLVRVCKIGQALGVFIADNGCGIKKEDQSRIFEPGQAADGAIASSHMGLTIVRDIVGFLGGDLGVDSEQGRGACFYVLLPDISSVGNSETK
ncbi:MAG: ATP-binding protein, partial [Patescibacteria group bacterium]